MIQQSATHWIRRARAEGWALGMFNAHHLEAVQAVAAAAQARRAPVMLSTTMGGITHVGLDYFLAMAAVARKRVDVPLILHLDHGADFDTVQQCIERGFDSVMIDASSSDYERNVELVRKVVRLARRHGVGVEAQIGETHEEEGDRRVERMTTVEEAVAFIADTDVDYLAISIGNRPGSVGEAAPIDIDLVQRIGAAIDRPLVLHGGTSVPAEILPDLITGGIAKINIDAATKNAFRTALTSHYGVAEPGIDTRQPLAEARRLAQAAIEERIVSFRAEGRAD